MLKAYVDVHNYIFKRSIRRIMPIPLVYRSIDFDTCLSALQNVSRGLDICSSTNRQLRNSCNGDLAEYLDSLHNYVAALQTTVALLQKVVRGLMSKIPSRSNYSWHMYRADIREYKRSIDAYYFLGGSLNKELRSLGP